MSLYPEQLREDKKTPQLNRPTKKQKQKKQQQKQQRAKTKQMKQNKTKKHQKNKTKQANKRTKLLEFCIYRKVPIGESLLINGSHPLDVGANVWMGHSQCLGQSLFVYLVGCDVLIWRQRQTLEAAHRLLLTTGHSNGHFDWDQWGGGCWYCWCCCSSIGGFQQLLDGSDVGALGWKMFEVLFGFFRSILVCARVCSFYLFILLWYVLPKNRIKKNTIIIIIIIIIITIIIMN